MRADSNADDEQDSMSRTSRIVGAFRYRFRDATMVNRNVWLGAVILLLLSLGTSTLFAPSLRLIENAACRQYYMEHEPTKYPDRTPIPERDCKLQPIQTSLASLLTVITVSTNLVELIVQVPLGVLADRRGGGLAIALNISSYILYWGYLSVIGFLPASFPLWSYYLAPLFLLIGGGPRTTGTLIFAVANDSVKPEHRTTSFSLIEAISYITDFLAPVIGSSLMLATPAAPFICSTSLFVLAYVPTCLLRGSIIADNEEGQHHFHEGTAADPLLGDVDPINYGEIGHDLPVHDEANTEPKPFLVVLRNRDVTLCIGAMFVIALARMCMNFLLLYISRQYGWSTAEAGFLFTIKAAVAAALFGVLVPAFKNLLDRYTNSHTGNSDICLSQVSMLLAIAGCLMLGFGWHVSVAIVGLVSFTLSYGMNIALLSILSVMVQKGQTARIFMISSIAQTVGAMIGMPLMGALYAASSDKGSGFPGAPYDMAALLYTVALVMVTLIRTS